MILCISVLSVVIPPFSFLILLILFFSLCFLMSVANCLSILFILSKNQLLALLISTIFNYYLLKYFLMVFLFVFFFWDSYGSNVGVFNIVLEVSEIVLISFNSFFFFPLWFIYFYNSIFYFTNSIFCLYYILLFVPSRVFLISFIALFIIYWLFFISSKSLLNLSCIFSILVSGLFICDSILISRFWIIFTIIIQNSLSGRFYISSSFVWFGWHLSCSFTWWVFLCLFILFILLCLRWPFCILAVWGDLFIVEFPHCGWGCTGGLTRFPG